MHNAGTITPLKDQTDYLGIKNSKYDFYLGGTDSCQGDSGGPLYLWTKDKGRSEKRATIIGVVSRGTGCANFNKPGIFTKVQHHIEWIHKIIKSGNCKKNESTNGTADEELYRK